MSTPPALQIRPTEFQSGPSPEEMEIDDRPLSRNAESRADCEADDLRDRFDGLAEELEQAAAGLSSTRRAMVHPAFTEILALGDEVIPKCVNRLKTTSNRPLWLRVLGTLTPFSPGAGQQSIDAAAEAWLRWSHQSRSFA